MKASRLARLRDRIEPAWSAATSNDGLFCPEVPSRGQCCVTALVIQDRLGGEIVRAPFEDRGQVGSHYWNRFPEGDTIDITRDQFSDDVKFGPIETRERAALLSNENTLRRYDRLRQQMLWGVY